MFGTTYVMCEVCKVQESVPAMLRVIVGEAPEIAFDVVYHIPEGWTGKHDPQSRCILFRCPKHSDKILAVVLTPA